MRVQDEMDKRARLETPSGRRRIKSGKYALSGIVYCAHCGEAYQRTHWDIHGKKKIVWRCVSRLYKNKTDAECSARTINETDLHAAVIKAINEVYAKQSDFLPQLKTNIQKVLSNANNVSAIAEIDNKIKEKEKTLINLIKTKQNYDELGDEIIRLKEQKRQLQFKDANANGEQEKIAELETFLNEQSSSIKEFDDALARRLLESVTVYDDKYKVRFKSGIEIDIK